MRQPNEFHRALARAALADIGVIKQRHAVAKVAGECADLEERRDGVAPRARESGGSGGVHVFDEVAQLVAWKVSADGLRERGGRTVAVAVRLHREGNEDMAVACDSLLMVLLLAFGGCLGRGSGLAARRLLRDDEVSTHRRRCVDEDVGPILPRVGVVAAVVERLERDGEVLATHDGRDGVLHEVVPRRRAEAVGVAVHRVGDDLERRRQRHVQDAAPDVRRSVGTVPQRMAMERRNSGDVSRVS